MLCIRTFLIAFSLFFFYGTQLQAQLFGAGIVAGVNAAQIQGDASAGYNRLGVRAGLRGVLHLGEKLDMGFDMMYSTRGSTTELFPNNNFLRFIIHLDYVEVPVWVCYSDWLSPEGFYRVHWKAGLSYGRLFNTRVEELVILEDEQDNFAKNDMSIVLGIGYRFSKKFSLEASYNRSLVPLYNNQKFLNNQGLPIYKHRLFGYFLSFQGIYEF